MLSGEVSLEDFVQIVESSSGIERWALWMEISGRLQIAQQQHGFPNGTHTFEKKGADAILPLVSSQNMKLSKLRTAERRHRGDEISSMERDRMLAQSIVKKQLLNTRSTQTIESDFTSIPYFDDGTTEIALDSRERPNDMARIVRTSAGAAASSRTEHPQPVLSRLDGTGRTSGASSATVTSGRRALSGQSTTSGRIALGSTAGRAGRAVPDVLDMPDAAARNEEKAAARVADARVGAMQALCQGLGLCRAKLSDGLVRRLKTVLDVGLCRLLFVETGHDPRAPELVQMTEEALEAKDRRALAGGILGEALRLNRCLHVSNLGSCTYHVPEDLGVDAADAELWRTGRAVCVPVLGSSGTALAVLLVARTGSQADFSSAEAELLAWLAVLLGRVVEDSDERSSLEGAIAVAAAAADQVVHYLLDRPGVGEGLDPHLWMACFRSETAQIAVVYRGPGETEDRLYCTSSDVSREGVAMICRPLSGLCRRIALQGSSDAHLFSDVLMEPGVDRGVDLAGSEFGGRTALLLVPVMGQEDAGRVVAILGISSTVMVYGPLHLALLRALTLVLKHQILALVRAWDTDPARTFEANFVPSKEIVAAEAAAAAAAVAAAAAAEAISGTSGAAPGVGNYSSKSNLEEDLEDGGEDMLYNYSRRSIDKMIDLEQVGMGPSESRGNDGQIDMVPAADGLVKERVPITAAPPLGGKIGEGNRRKTGMLRYIATKLPDVPASSSDCSLGGV